MAVFVAATFAMVAVLSLPLSSIVPKLRAVLPGRSAPGPVAGGAGPGGGAAEPGGIRRPPVPLARLASIGAASAIAFAGGSGFGFVVSGISQPPRGGTRPLPPVVPGIEGPVPLLPPAIDEPLGPPLMGPPGSGQPLADLVREVVSRMPEGLKRSVAKSPHPRRSAVRVVKRVARAVVRHRHVPDPPESRPRPASEHPVARNAPASRGR